MKSTGITESKFLKSKYQRCNLKIFFGSDIFFKHVVPRLSIFYFFVMDITLVGDQVDINQGSLDSPNFNVNFSGKYKTPRY